MPTFADPLVKDPIRVVAPMTVTAPFYAGVAYGLDALTSRLELPSKLLSTSSGVSMEANNTADEN
jgi:hypothetical protein